MKIRNGFVSNSSSSSFCIMGYIPDIETYVKTHDKYEDWENGDYSEDDGFFDDLTESIPKGSKLEVDGAPWYGIEAVIGISYKNLDFNIPLSEQTKSIAEEISKVLGYEVKEEHIYWQTGCWRDG